MTDEIMEMNDAVEVETGNFWTDTIVPVVAPAVPVFIGVLGGLLAHDGITWVADKAGKALCDFAEKAKTATEAKKAEEATSEAKTEEKVEAEVVDAPKATTKK